MSCLLYFPGLGVPHVERGMQATRGGVGRAEASSGPTPYQNIVWLPRVPRFPWPRRDFIVLGYMSIVPRNQSFFASKRKGLFTRGAQISPRNTHRTEERTRQRCDPPGVDFSEARSEMWPFHSGRKARSTTHKYTPGCVLPRDRCV